MNSLNSLAGINRVSFKGKYENMEIGLSEEELKKRTHKDYLSTKKMLEADAVEYKNLADGDKKALRHLVKASYILDPVYSKQDSVKNIPFRNYLKEEIKKGNINAKMALKLYSAQKGINAVDAEATKFSLMKGEKETLGKAFYPEDLSVEEFHNILIKMLEGEDKEKQDLIKKSGFANMGEIKESMDKLAETFGYKKRKSTIVGEILNQRSIVVRDGDELKAIPYTEIFKKEFTTAAKEIEKAAEASTNSDFSEYLKLQAKALIQEDPMLDAYADKKWATLQDTPLEFTITRENYEDEFTGTVVENEKLNKLLQEHGIVPVPKDSLGFRVGIVNKEGTEKLLEIKKYLPILVKEMPLAGWYEQNISSDLAQEVKQTMVDVDLVAVTGDVGAFRGGITLAENLPNDDKLSLTIGGGRRNVYHRQIRKITDFKKLQKRLDAVLDKNFHQYYENEADHWFTIGHENAHSLGPNNGTEALGKYRSIIEEAKADMASMAMVDKLTELGMYDEKQRKQIITTFVADNLLKAKPNINQAHRVRTVMQMNYLIKEGAVNIDEKGVVSLEMDKVVPAARKMLEEIVEIQLSKNFAKGEKFVLDNFVWSEGMEKVAQKLKKINKTLNGQVKAPLANKLLRMI